MTEHPPPTLHILEGGFRLRPEQVAAYAKRHEEFMPYVIKQPGFRETYGGPIPRSPWWFFTAKFDTLEDMEQWQKDREHVDVQDSARDVVDELLYSKGTPACPRRIRDWADLE